MSITAPSRETPWADDVDGDDIVEPADGQKETGWTLSQAELQAPPYQWFNWILQRLFRWAKYLRVRGLPDYFDDQNYSVGDIAQHTGGIAYRCIAANGPDEAVGVKAPGSGNEAYWSPWPLDPTVPASGIASTVGTVSNVVQLSVPPKAGITGYRRTSFLIADCGNPNASLQITMSGAAAAGSNSVLHVSFYGDWDQTMLKPALVALVGSNQWTISWTLAAVNGAHPGLYVSVDTIISAL